MQPPRIQPALLRSRHADGNIGFALGQAEYARIGDQFDFQFRMLACQPHQLRRQKVSAPGFRGTDPDRSHQPLGGIVLAEMNPHRQAFQRFSIRESDVRLRRSAHNQPLAGRTRPRPAPVPRPTIRRLSVE